MQNQTIQYVPHTSVKVREGFNPRIKPYTDDIKDSILDHGVRDAAEVEDNGDGTFTLNAQGHRRLLAVTELHNEGHTKTKIGDALLFPIKVVPKVTTPDELEQKRIEIITLNTGRPLMLLEEAAVYADLVKGIDPANKPALREKSEQIATKVGRTGNHVRNLLNLLNCTPVTRKLIENGKVSASLAIELFLKGTAKDDWQKVEDALTKAVAEAVAHGKKKATIKDTTTGAKGGQAPAEETPEQKKEREEKEASAAALKSRNKEIQGIASRAAQAMGSAIELAVKNGKEENKATPLEVALSDVVLFTSAYINGKDVTSKGVIVEGSDTPVGRAAISGAYRDVLKAHKEIVKVEVKAAKDSADDDYNRLKEKHAAEVKALRDRIAAASVKK